MSLVVSGRLSRIPPSDLPSVTHHSGGSRLLVSEFVWPCSAGRHPNVVTLLGFGQNEEKKEKYLVYELLECGDVSGRLQKSSFGLACELPCSLHVDLFPDLPSRRTFLLSRVPTGRELRSSIGSRGRKLPWIARRAWNT